MIMKKTPTSIAAALTILLALSGCNSNNNSKEESSSLNWTLEQFLIPPYPVETATGNTLSSTPDDILNLVSDFDIDIRNSAFLILQNAQNNKSYAQVVTANKARHGIVEAVNRPTTDRIKGFLSGN